MPSAGARCSTFDPIKAQVVGRVLTLRRQHSRWTLQRITDQVTADGYTTAHGAAFQRMTVKRILDRPAVKAKGGEADMSCRAKPPGSEAYYRYRSGAA